MSFTTAAATLRRMGSVARTRDLIARGATAREISRAARAHEIIRVRQGVYALPDAPSALCLAAAHGGVPTCADAARVYGLWTLGKDSRIHIWLGGSGHRRPGGGDCHCHWTTGRPKVGELPPVRLVLLHLAQCGGEEALFVSLESARRQFLLSRFDLRWLASHLPPPLRWLVGFSRDDADSGLESLVRLRLFHLGIHVLPQVAIDDVGIVDFLIGGRLIIECDGADNHGGAERRHKDLMRDAAAAEHGYETLRFDYAMIVHDWPQVSATILAKVKAGAHLRAS